MNPQRNVDSKLHKIQVDGQKLQTNHVYYLLNKPSGVVTAKKDTKFQTATELVKESERPEALYPVGRLDRDTTGLLLLTDNGQLGYDLLQPESKVTKTYRVIVNEAVTMEDVEAFKAGIVFHGGVRCQPARLSIVSSTSRHSEVLLTIKEGKFHQVKKNVSSMREKSYCINASFYGTASITRRFSRGEVSISNDYRASTIKNIF